ncbi:MAG: hypothetical protein HY736_09350 [Verrucomicrobia bacterium]|nr:hypothetical protein [Verrucomicrobiota bacterium]
MLIACYDGVTADAGMRLVNASARAFVGACDDVLIPGFVIGGEGVVRLLVRAVGPGLASFGVPGTLADPQLTLYQGDRAIDSNNDWDAATNAADIARAAGASGAFPLAQGSRDATLLVTLPAGAYTAKVSGAGNGTGAAMVEIYAVP